MRTQQLLEEETIQATRGVAVGAAKGEWLLHVPACGRLGCNYVSGGAGNVQQPGNHGPRSAQCSLRRSVRVCALPTKTPPHPPNAPTPTAYRYPPHPHPHHPPRPPPIALPSPRTCSPDARPPVHVVAVKLEALS